MSDFNAWSASALWTILEVTAQASLCVLIILALRRVLGEHLRPNWRYALWGLLLFRLLLPFSYDFTLITPLLPAKATPATSPAPVQDTLSPPAVAISNPRANTTASSDSNVAVLSAEEITFTPATVEIPHEIREPKPFPVAALLFTLWGAAVLGVLAFVVQRHFHFTRAIERDAVPASGEVSHLLRRVRDELRVSMWPVVLVSPSIAAPLVVGALHSRILLPKSFAESASPADLRHVLMHELIHVRRRDLVFAWLWLLALALHWFNPLIWRAGARMRRDREQACDQRVLAALPETERIAYGHTLLKAVAVSQGRPAFTRLAGSAAIVEDESELEGRLTMIREYRPARMHHRLSGSAAAVVLVLAAFVQVWVVAQEQEQSPEKETAADVTPNPFTGITDEAKLIELRDEAAKTGDIVRACEAEMRRVKLRAANDNPYRDKIDFAEAYSKLPKASADLELKKQMEALGPYLDSHSGENDEDYHWRIFHLMSLMARDMNEIDKAKGFLAAAMQTYPNVKYSEPSKHSKFQHLVNESAMLIWDTGGVDAAEKYVIDIWKNDRRFQYFYDVPWTERYAAENLPAGRLDALKTQLGAKPVLQQITILITPEGPRRGWNFYQPLAPQTPTTWEAIEEELKTIADPAGHFIALGYTSDEMPFKLWRDAEMRCMEFVKKYGFDHFSDIGQQQAPENIAKAAAQTEPDVAPDVDTKNPLDVAISSELRLHYAKASPEVQEFIRSTAKSFGRSGLWLPEIWDLDVDGENAAYLKKLFEEGTYGRHLCDGLAKASIIRDKNLVPGLIKIAAYHRDDQDYDCRPKWMAIAALARQEDERAVPTLVPLVDHGNLNTRMWAQAALARITDQSFGADKQAWANWWNAAGKQPPLGPDAVKPWTPPNQTAQHAGPPSGRILVVRIDAIGNYAIDGREMNRAQLSDAIRLNAAAYDSVQFYVDPAAPVEQFNFALDAARSAGVTQIRIIGPKELQHTLPLNVAQQGPQGRKPELQNVRLGTEPKIVSTSPKIGDAAVSPDLKELRVTFDQDMAGGFSWTGGGEAYPETTGKPNWIDKRTCVLPVKLVPGKYYRVGINAPSFKNFQSASYGYPVSPTSFWFITAGADGKPVAGFQPPRVVEITPANGATDVTPALTEIVVRFDKKMAAGFSWTDPEGKAPEITGEAVWRDDGKTCALPVKVQPGREYMLSLNSAWHTNFQSASGVPMLPQRYTFSTKAE